MQWCGSVMFIPDPGSWFLPIRIPDLLSQNSNKRKGEKNCCQTYLFCSHKFHKIENYFIFEMLKKKIWANFQRIIEIFTQKLSLSPQNMSLGSGIWVSRSGIWDPRSGIWDPRSGIWDPRSGIRKKLFRIPDPGVKETRDPRSRIRGSATLRKCKNH